MPLESGIDPKINVVLSTFNGYMFLKEMLESLSNQRDVKIQLIYRDDGSIDGSKQLVQSYFPNAILCHHFTGNLGASSSYMHLFEHVPSEGLIAICDQDDVWALDKCKIAIDIINRRGHELYVSRVSILDRNIVFPKNVPNLSLMNSVYENSMIGTTMVFNQRILKILLKLRPTRLFHDEIINLIGVFSASVYYDKEPQVSYRLHANNSTGISRLSKSFNSKYIKRFLRLFELRSKARQKIDLLSELHNLGLNNNLFINQFIIMQMRLPKRLIVNLKNVRFRISIIENFIVKCLWRLGLI
jgi:glycosyltransferase involved in cell wall biosynthesis